MEPWSVFDFSTVFKEGGGVGSKALSKSEIYFKKYYELRRLKNIFWTENFGAPNFFRAVTSPRVIEWSLQHPSAWHPLVG